jgi:hypothetical protein
LVVSAASVDEYEEADIWKDFDVVMIPSFTLSDASATLDIINTTKTLTATFAAEYEGDQTITWASSDSAVATVSGGVITRVALGTATISATMYDYFTEICAVSVVKAAGVFGTPEAVNVAFTAGLTLAGVSLPTGYTWNDGTTALSVGNNQYFAATYTDPSDNYEAATGNITVNVAPATPIYDIKKSNNLYGIILRSSIVSDKMEIVSITLPNDNFKEAKVVIYDNVGNVVKELKTDNKGAATWDLTNGAGRSVANGSYLVVAEVKGTKGSYMYSAKVGVRR